MMNRRIYYLIALCLVSTQAFQKPQLISKKKPVSTSRLNSVVLPSSNEPNMKRKNIMKPPIPPNRSPSISQVDLMMIPKENFLEESIDDHPFGPKTKLGHHLVDGLYLDALVLRTAPLEAGYISGHLTFYQAPSVQQHVDTFATTLKSFPVSQVKTIADTLPGYMPLPGLFLFLSELSVFFFFSSLLPAASKPLYAKQPLTPSLHPNLLRWI